LGQREPCGWRWEESAFARYGWFGRAGTSIAVVSAEEDFCGFADV
jgi:hypothetical protein